MKAVLISIQPKWVALIASDRKPIEVRKTKPKLQTPFKVYIYCTNDRKVFRDSDCNNKFWTEKNYGGKHYYNGKVIGEFVCDRIDEYGAEFTDLQYPDACDKNVCLNSIKQVEYDEEEDGPVYRYVTSNEEENPDDCKFLKESCLTFNDVRKYIGETCYDKHFYAWHITDLKIYDKPKELDEFYPIKPKRIEDWTDKDDCTHCKYHKWVGSMQEYVEKGKPMREKCTLGKPEPICEYTPPISRPPQSWCYVEELQNG